MSDAPRLERVPNTSREVAQRISSLERRLAIVDSVRDQLAGEISRAKAGHRSLMRDSGSVYIDNPKLRNLRSALRLNDISHKARKHLRAAVGQFERFGDFGFALERTLSLLVMTAPYDAPRSRRDEILIAAVEREHDRDAVWREVENVEGPISDAAFRTALARGRKARKARDARRDGVVASRWRL